MAQPCPSEELLSRFDEGSLPDAERAQVLSHVEGCDGCRQVVAALAGLRISRTLSSPGADVPVVLARYRVLGELGRGAVGRVYAAEDSVLGRRVALKVVRDATSESGQLLMRESRAVARLSHRNVITIHDVVLREGWGFLAMECLDGGNLATWLETPRTVAEVLPLFVQVAQGLAAAHHAGLIHRDLKPANVLLGAGGRACVSDFGLARVAGDPLLATLSDSGGGGTKLVGTPAYMAPEQFEGKPLTAAADQFAFFVALHEAVAGSRPFEGASVESLGAAVRSGRRRPPARAIPARLAALIDRGLSVDPAARFPSMDEVVRALTALGAPTPFRKRWLVPAAAAVALVAGGAAFLGARRAPCPPLTGRELVWTAAQRAMVTRGLARDPEVSKAVIAAFDETAARLDHEWSQGCALERPVAQRARQQVCLTDMLSQLDVSVQTLAGVPPDLAARALPVVRTLPDPGSCAKVETVTERRPPPTGEPARTLVREGRVLMLEAEALRRLGRYPEAMERTTRARRNAEQARDLALQADALRLEARLHNNIGTYEPAEVSIRAAVPLAQASGDAVLLGRVAFSAGFIECFNLVHTAHCEEARRLLEETAARQPAEELLAMVAELRAGIAGADFDLETTVRETATAQEHWARVPQSAEDQLRARHSLLNALLDDLRMDRALEEQAVLQKDAARYWGPNHPRVLQYENMRSRALVALGRFEEATRSMDGQMERIKTLLGPLNSDASDVWIERQNVAEAQGRLEDALEAERNAVAGRSDEHFLFYRLPLLVRLGLEDEAAPLRARLEASLDWRKEPPSLARLDEAQLLIESTPHDPAYQRQVLDWVLAGLRARAASVAPNSADLHVQLAVAELALGGAQSREARAALTMVDRLLTERRHFELELRAARLRAELLLLEGDRVAAERHTRATLRTSEKLGLNDANTGLLHLALAVALGGKSPEACAAATRGFAMLVPYKGIDVSARRAQLAACQGAQPTRAK